MALRLREARSGPATPQLVEFKWRYRGHDGRFSGDGGVRVNPPDSIRLDLLEPGGSGVQSAVMIGLEVRYIGKRRLQLPPPTFIWAMFGVFRPPAGITPLATRIGERTRLTYRLASEESVSFDFDSMGRLIEAERRVDGDAVQRIRVKNHDVTEVSESFSWPREARFRDLVEFVEVRVQVLRASDHEPFERRIFEVAAR